MECELRIRTAYVVMILLSVATAAVAAIMVVGNPWMKPAPAISDQRAELEPPPPRSDALAKGDRLPSAAPPPAQSSEPASLALETARQALLVPPNEAFMARPAPAKPTTVLLDDKQIASIKQRLKLTKAQEPYWPPVESALKELVRMIHNQRKQPVQTLLDPGEEAVKRLMVAAKPFLAQLRNDQRNEIRQLARMAGLGSELPTLN